MAGLDIPDFDRAYDYLSHYGESRPASEAAVCSGLRLNYRALKRRVDECARALIGAGVSPATRGYLSPAPRLRGRAAATLAVGGIAVGVNPGYPRREIGTC